MDNKVKWAVISISSAVFPTFASLVTNNTDQTNVSEDVSVNSESTNSINSSDSTNSQESTVSESRGETYFNGPSGGFDQSHGSSGSSR